MTEAEPPGTRVMAVVRWGILLAVALLAAGSFWFLLAPATSGPVKYACPMVEHANVVSDEPGECPLCHMQLAPFDPALIEARKEEAARELADAGPIPPGMVPLALHLDRVQKGGVRSVPVIEAEIGEGPRAPVVVAAPEQGESRVHVRAAGFVEKMLVSEVGTSVAAGQTLALVYAPEVYRAQEEYLAARRWHEADGGPGPELDPARRRLELLGLTRADLEAIDQAGTPTRALPLRAPAGGQILRREIALGAHVSPEQMLYEIADLSRVYLVADVLTADLSRVKLGASAPVSFGPAGEVEAVVDLVYPEINAATRTTRVRLRPKTRLAGLRPGLYGELSLPAAHRRGLVVPRDAIIDTGRSVHVFVDQGDGHFMPRPVTIGVAVGDRVEVREGLAKGDLVVSGAAFLLDAESRLSAALTGLDTPPGASSAGPSGRPPTAASAGSSVVAPSPRPAGSP